MKKFLILVLVLGMVSMANATLQISVNGIQDPVESEIYATPSEILILDIWTDAQIAPQVGEVYYALACQVADATISGGYAEEPYASQPDLNLTIYDDAVGMGWVPLPAGENGVYGGVFSTGGSIPAGATIFNGIEFHCEWAPNDVVVTLYEVDPGWGFVTPIDSVIVHQIPEPATIALLGLGGLLLRRRK